MHIHGAIQNVQGAGFYGVSNGERAIAAQRAAETRRRLLKSAHALDADAGQEMTEESALVSQWMDARHSHVLTGDEDRATESGRDPAFG